MEHLPYFMTESDSVPGDLVPETTYLDLSLLLVSTGEKDYVLTYSYF